MQQILVSSLLAACVLFWRISQSPENPTQMESWVRMRVNRSSTLNRSYQAVSWPKKRVLCLSAALAGRNRLSASAAALVAEEQAEYEAIP